MKGMSKTYHVIEEGKAEFSVRKPLTCEDILLTINGQKHKLSPEMARELSKCLDSVIFEITYGGIT